MGRYVALVRGINVGGKNLIKMSALKACFEDIGVDEVATYIQSGNVLFSSPTSSAELTMRIEEAVARTFGCKACVMLRTRRQMQDIVSRAPDGFGEHPDSYRYDVVYLKPPLTAAVALRDVPTREGVDDAHAGVGVLYFSRLVRKASQSRLSRVVSLPIYQNMTIRNWNTTTKLLQLLGDA